jgi:hypothetical protein
MISIKNTIKVFLLIVLFPVIGNTQFEDYLASSPNYTGFDKKLLPSLKVRRSGPYFGIQRGKYTIVEFGGEMQWNKVKFRKPITHAAHMGFNYNFKYNVLGYDAGYWFKVGRLDLTYGANLVFRSDFDHNAFGIAPVVGFKFWQLHLQTGYHFLGREAKQFETNTLFVSLRYVFINNRDWNWKREKKKK